MRSIFFTTLLTLICVRILCGCNKEENVAGNDPGWITDKVIASGVEYRLFRSNTVGGDVSFHIFIPDHYYSRPGEHFPVLYYLHGTGDGTIGIPMLASYFKQAINSGHIRPMLVVFPNGLPEGMWCDSKDGKQPVESMVVNDLIPFIDSQYRTIGTAAGRLVEGFSMGGYGAGRLGLKYHSMFAGFSMLGAGPLQLDFLETGPYVPMQKRLNIFRTVYGSDMSYFEAQSPWRLAESVAAFLPDSMKIRIVVGLLDNMLFNNRLLHNHFNELGINHNYFEVPDIGHVPVTLLNSLMSIDPGFYNSVFEGF